MHISLATEEEVHGKVITFLVEQIANSYHWLDDQGLETLIADKVETIHLRFPHPGFMLCGWDGGELIATASFEAYPNPAGRAVLPAYLGNLFVRSDYRSQGVGAQMIDARENLAREQGINLLISEVLQRNSKAKKFLRSQGFKATGGQRISSIHGHMVQSFCKGL